MEIRKLFLAGSCLALVLALAGTPAFADRAVETALETVVVTAAPPDPVGNDAFSTVKVTAKQLRSEHQIDQALKEVPGLSLFRRDGSLSANPTTQGVTLRSLAPSGAGRALVTLDGVPQNDPFGNWVIWSALPAEDMGGAEIVRGAGAGPYGAGALTGVIALDEATGTGLVAADLSSGTRWQRRAAASGGVDIDRFEIFASASAEASNGFTPVLPPQRGPADDALTLDARNASLRVQTTVDADTLVSARFGAYQEFRNSGLVGAESSADGLTASLTIAHPESANELGWRAQVWLRDVGLTNTSVSIGTNRQSTTVTNDQYAVPATGWGGNAALRGQWDWLNWELGTDARFSEGESRELFSTNLASRRISGGRESVEGIYTEGAARFDGLLVTVGLRADEWETANGHLVESDAATGAISKSLSFPSRSGTLPTARAGLRYDLGDGLYLRGAAYEGFRAPSLNELYRPFRVGIITTQANPALTPENLYGAEGGIGGDEGAFSWQGTFFWNQLHNPIANVTTGTNLQTRENSFDVNALGVEADAAYRLQDWVTLRGAFDYVAARTKALITVPLPQLVDTHPAQAPRWTATAGFDATPFAVPLTLSADLRYESGRFADDLNTIPLSAATTIDARASWGLTGQVSVYIYADNLFNAHVASTAAQQPVPYQSAPDLVTNYSTPRIVGAGVSFAQ
jgi:outer membrane receptor protein involved in Fe transport